MSSPSLRLADLLLLGFPYEITALFRTESLLVAPDKAARIFFSPKMQILEKYLFWSNPTSKNAITGLISFPDRG